MFFSDDKFEKQVVFYFHSFFLGRDWFKHTHKEYHNLNPYLFDSWWLWSFAWFRWFLKDFFYGEKMMWKQTSSAHGLELGLMWLSNTGVLVVQKGLNWKIFSLNFPNFFEFIISSSFLWIFDVPSSFLWISRIRISNSTIHPGVFFLFLVSNISRYFFPQTWNLSTWIS